MAQAQQGFCGPSQGTSGQPTQSQGSFCGPAGAQQGGQAPSAPGTGTGQTPAYSNSSLCSESDTPKPSNLLATPSKASPWDLPGRRWGS